MPVSYDASKMLNLEKQKTEKLSQNTRTQNTSCLRGPEKLKDSDWF